MFKKTRENYVRDNMEKVISMTGTELYMRTDMTRPYPFMAMGFSGKKSMYDFYLCFQTAEKRNEYVVKWENGIKAHAKRIQERKDARKAPTTLKTGDILYTSWGYKQTNVDWYQVTKVLGKKAVEIRQIYGTSNTEGMPLDQGRTLPNKDAFIPEAKPMKKITGIDNKIAIASYASAWIWDGQPKFYSTYG